MNKVTEKHWKEVDKIGINRDTLEEAACGLWFRTVGGHMLANQDQLKKLSSLNTAIQAN